MLIPRAAKITPAARELLKLRKIQVHIEVVK